MNEQDSLKFVQSVASENGMRNVEKATLGQIYSFLDSLSCIKPIPKKVKTDKVLTKKEKTKLKNNQKIHFKRRFQERVGYVLTDEKYDVLCDLIRKDGHFLSKHEGSNQSIFSVNYERINLKVVYNAYDNILITVLP
jgi:hypothetical protein